MGNQASAIDPVHTRIYYNMIQIQDPLKRIQMIQTCAVVFPLWNM